MRICAQYVVARKAEVVVLNMDLPGSEVQSENGCLRSNSQLRITRNRAREKWNGFFSIRLWQVDPSFATTVTRLPSLLFLRPLPSHTMATKVVTIEELRANKKKDSMYVLLHGKGTHYPVDCIS